MHVKRIHEMIEKLTECAKAELDRGVEQVDTEEFGAVVDAIKDLCCAEKDAKIVKQMEESAEEENREEEYLLRMMKEEYGEDEGKRYYDNYRYANGRFAPKGRGTYRSRRGYEEPHYRRYPEEYDPEYYRDMDRASMNRMYYPGGGSGGNAGGGTSGNSAGGSSGISGGSSGGSTGGSGGASSSGGGSMGYSESLRYYSDGNSSRGSRGYGNEGRSESRSERARRNYTETKEMHNGNTPNDKQANMKELENYFIELGEDMAELVKNMSPEEKNLAKSKISALASKM